MGIHKNYKGLEKLPEVLEIMDIFEKRGLRMQKKFTEIHFIPEKDRLRLCVHDDGMQQKETVEALEIAADIVLKYGYERGSNNEYYKYFKLTQKQ